MVPRLAKMISKCNEQQIVKLADSPASSKRAAAAELLALKAGAPDSNQTLKKLADDKDAFVRCRLAKGLAARKTGGAGLLKKLSADSLAQVRAEACLNVYAADDQGRADILVQMTADPSAAVRLNAVKSLGSAKNSDTVLDSLSKCLADEDNYVRIAAEDSYVSLKPGDGQLKRFPPD
jgi:HEAT repeat protein